MAFSQGSRSSLSYIVESTFGTTPTGDFTNLPFSTHSVSLTKDRVEGTDIQADRMPRVDRHGNRQVGGDIVADLRDTDFDDFLEAAMLNVWTSDVLKVGTTPKFFSVEDYAADIDIARRFTGMTVSTMGVSLAPNQMVTTTFGMVGKDMNPTIDAGNFVNGDSYTIVSVGTTDFTLIGSPDNVVGTTFQATGAGAGTGTASVAFEGERTQVANSGAAPFDAYSGDLEIDGTAAAIVTAMDFTVNNGYAPTFVVGSDTTPSLEYGLATVEGTLSAYFEDADLISRFVDETETSLKVTIGDGTNTMEFFFPRCKINSSDVGVDGPASRIISIAFVALYDATEDTNLRITRS